VCALCAPDQRLLAPETDRGRSLGVAAAACAAGSGGSC